QPALSRQLQKLQRHLRIDLLQSHHSGIGLTAAGEEFLPVAHKVVDEIYKAEAFARMLSTGKFTEITFAAPGTTLIDIVIPFVATLDSSQLHSHVIETPLGASLEQAVNTADLVIMPSEPPSELDSIALVELPVWAYVAAEHPWADRDEIVLEELVEERVVVTTTDFMSRRVLDGAVDVAGLTVPQIVETNSGRDRKSTRLNSSHVSISYAVFCLKKKTNKHVIKYAIETPVEDMSTIHVNAVLPNQDSTNAKTTITIILKYDVLY